MKGCTDFSPLALLVLPATRYDRREGGREGMREGGREGGRKGRRREGGIGENILTAVSS